MLTIVSLLLFACHAVDGDTLRCGNERIRLLGIDAPEMPGHCRRGRQCVPGDPWASQRSLQRALASGSIRIRRTGRDRYNRTLAVVWAGQVNLSCWQIDARQAIYIERWDDGRRVARECSSPP